MSFEHIEDPTSRMFLVDIHKAMDISNSWEALRSHKDDSGFQYKDEAKPLLDNINLLSLHSGFSMNWAMSHMKSIATLGYDGYVNDFMRKEQP